MATAPVPSPALFFETINSYQRTAALKAAIELEVFTGVGEGKTTSQALAERAKTSQRGMRILCDYLTIIGIVDKKGRPLRADTRLGLFFG